MLSVLQSAAAGLDASGKTQEVLARNIANASHPGYRRATLSFADELRGATGASAVSAKEGIGFEQGELLRTESPLDLALEGDGFFTLQKPDGGLLYTRKGSFVLGEDGRIETSTGFTLQGTSGPILLPPGTTPTIRKDGSVVAGDQVVGKLRIPAEILTKPGQLTGTEFLLIREHPQASYDLLKGIDFPWPVADIAYQHHERLDGSGYPRGLKGEDMLPEARILAVADVFEAMSSHRPYRPALGPEVALAELLAHRGTLYDPDAVDACVRIVREKGFTLD